MSTTLSQNHSSDRIEIIDALRGFALLGIIIAHMTEQFYAGMPPEKYPEVSSLADSIVSGIVAILIMGKFYMIFSFLFGLSFYIQFSKAKSDLPFVLKFSWRLILLFIIGLIHHIHYRGDILTIYAMLGFGLLLTYRLPDKYLLLLGILLVIDLPAIITRMTGLITGDNSLNDFIRPDQSILVSYYETFKSGAYIDLIKANLSDFKTKMMFQVWSGRLYMTFGLFLLGYYAGKQNFFHELQNRIPFIKKLMRISLWSLLGVVVTGAAVMITGNALTGGMSEDANIGIGISFADIANACLATLYVCWFILLFQKDTWRDRLMIFYAAGRMGLTTYLLQAVFGLFVYSTLGLGLLGELGKANSFLLAILFFTFQLWISKVWLTHFQYGPVEWVWRCLTNLKLHALTKPVSKLERQVA
ncbi:MAG TPA: DUF418 domain-containing protein [Ohtaekwangia sp.]